MMSGTRHSWLMFIMKCKVEHKKRPLAFPNPPTKLNYSHLRGKDSLALVYNEH